MSRPIYVHGIGTAVPPTSLGPEESVQLFRQAFRNPRAEKLLRRVVRLTGIRKRHLAVLDSQLDEKQPPLYLPAAEQPDGPGMGARNGLFDGYADGLVREVLAALPRDALADVGTLITVSCTHASSPGLEAPVFAHGPVPRDADRWNLGFMGCSAGLAALRLLARSGVERPALALACELSSLHFQYAENLDQLTANLLFADGAAAVLLSSEPSAVRVLDARSVALPEHAGQMVWFGGDHGLRLHLAAELPDTLSEHVPGAVDAFLARGGRRRDGVDHWLVHPGGPQILDAVAASLGLPEDALRISRGVLEAYGNMSSPTIFFILRELIEQRVDGTCLAMAFGPGLTVELVLLEMRRG